MSKWDVFRTPEAQSFFATAGQAMNAKMEKDMAKLMGEAMANEQDRRYRWMELSMIVMNLPGPPAILGFEE